MDIKVKGLHEDILANALNQARKGRLFILDKMNQVINKPRAIYRHMLKDINIKNRS